MNVTAYKRDPEAPAASQLRPRPRLAVAPTQPKRNVARLVAGYAAGMAGGFALAAVASAPGGLDVVVGQGRLVLIAAVVAAAAMAVDLVRRRRST